MYNDGMSEDEVNALLNRAMDEYKKIMKTSRKRIKKENDTKVSKAIKLE